ncbi:hypothetical protein PRZ48_012347 [Zasmidium cellare]|uniref:NAD(P)-binding protein n=1 Tax=Zasmidium cellare TaxID=395010 RepID=A0ABR0E4K1_ZASCE|nr:hypothetical protein PRZ48_012347 [Zasmidium cellare]
MSGPTPSAGLGLLFSQATYRAPLPTESFEGQTIIVTGANAGLGRDAVRHLVRLNASRVILAVRTISKGEEAQAAIEEEYGRKGVMEVWQIDMAKFASVRAFAQRAQGLDRLDAVLLNAGIWPKKFEMAEGHEATVTTNVISTFLLARLLLPKLQETSKLTQTIPRMSVVDSDLHKFAKLTTKKDDRIFEGLKKPVTDYDGRYHDTKLLVVLYGRKLAAQMSKSGQPKVCLNFVNPGWCSSGLNVREGAGVAVAKRLLQRSQDEGGRMLVDAIALVPRVEERHGQYINKMRVEKYAAWVYSKEGEATAEKVWAELNEILEKESV